MSRSESKSMSPRPCEVWPIVTSPCQQTPTGSGAPSREQEHRRKSRFLRKRMPLKEVGDGEELMPIKADLLMHLNRH